MQLAPVVVFTYNRLSETKRMIETLKKCKESIDTDLIIFSDGPKCEADNRSVYKVREYLRTIDGFKSIRINESYTNKGLANSIITGVSNIIYEYEKVIVVEDDLLLSEGFLSYMNQALVFYKNNPKIWSISGYNVPVNFEKIVSEQIYLSYRASSWGWGTWKDRWLTIDWDIKDYERFIKSSSNVKAFNRGGRDLSLMLKMQKKGFIDSWAIRWCYNQYLQDKYTVYPVNSLVINDGFGTESTHTLTKSSKTPNIDNYSKCIVPELVENSINENAIKLFRDYYSSPIKNIIQEILVTTIYCVSKVQKKNANCIEIYR